jgi:Subtilase family/Carboxypeptidase regulatory-like domain
MVNEPLTGTPPAGVNDGNAGDTGVDYTHPELAGKVFKGRDYVGRGDLDPMDLNGQGTHLAGIAAAKANNGGIRGISPNSKIYAYRVLDANGYGSFANIVAAIYSAANNPEVRVLSLSLGGYAPLGSPAYNDMKAAVDYAVVTKGKIVVAAAGNGFNDDIYHHKWSGSSYRPIPASIPNAFTVGATTETDSRVSYSNYDLLNGTSYDGTTTYSWNFVDIVAPGTNILSSTLGDSYQRWSGTSMAAALVAGAAARVWDANPFLTQAQVRSKLLVSGVTLSTTEGFPLAEKRLDLFKALGGIFTGGFRGRILHGETGQPLDGVQVEAMAGDTVAGTVYSDAEGMFVLPDLPSHTPGYTLRLSRSGFVTRTSDNFGNRPAEALTSLPGQVVLPSRPTTDTNENWRIVMSWTHQDPGSDFFVLPSLFITPLGGDDPSPWSPFLARHAAGLHGNANLLLPNGYSLDWTQSGSLDAYPYARVMDVSPGIPVASVVIADQMPGTYKFYFDFNMWGWGSIKYDLGTAANPSIPSYPVVYVYKGDTFKAVIRSTSATCVGTGAEYWNVLTLNGDTVTVINQID